MVMVRSDMAAKSGLCVTMTKVWFISSRRRKNSLCSSCADFESRLPEGSSADHRRTVDQSPRHGNALLLAAREFRRLVVFSCRKIQVFKQFFGFHHGFLFAHAADVGGNANVFDGRKLRQKVMKLEHEADFLVTESSQVGVIQFVDLNAIDDELPSVGLVQSTDDVEQGGFARARSPDDAHDFLLRNVQVDALEHF